MTKLIFLSLMMFALPLIAQEEQEIVTSTAFVPTAFGIRSRTIDVKDAEKVNKVISNYKLEHPEVKLIGIEILTCTSDYELPQNIVTNKKIDEHVELAKQRHMMIIEQVLKEAKLPVSGEARICGPNFSKDVLNDRFVTKESGAIYHEKFKALFNSEGFKEMLKAEALIENPEDLKALYPTPFLARFKPFQGVRVVIKGLKKNKSEARKAGPTPPSGKIQ